MPPQNPNQPQAPVTPTPAPVMPATPPSAPAAPTPPPAAPHESGWGAIIGVIIIVALIVAGGAYFFLQQKTMQQEAAADAQTAALQETSGSDEVSDIEADLQATQTGDLSTEANNLENAF